MNFGVAPALVMFAWADQQRDPNTGEEFRGTERKVTCYEWTWWFCLFPNINLRVFLRKSCWPVLKAGNKATIGLSKTDVMAGTE